MTATAHRSAGFRTWRARIEGGTVTAAACRWFAQNLAPLAAGTPKGYGRRPSVTPTEARELVAMLRAHPVTIADPDAGRAWLAGREGSRIVPHSVRDTFERFEYAGDYADVGHGAWSHFLPVWRIVATDGTVSHYYACPWQSGADHDGAWWPNDRHAGPGSGIAATANQASV